MCRLFLVDQFQLELERQRLRRRKTNLKVVLVVASAMAVPREGKLINGVFIQITSAGHILKVQNYHPFNKKN